ncbi:MAG: glycerol-3-phosphate dehydrogenase [Rhodospirillaceae bacterium]|nr:glycerol-3-phosphate dehydrogenase [Rhodospirillaceae bacterium]
MTEGSLGAPVRHTIPWQDEAYYDEAALDAELRRVFDVCHGCRLCFNLCDSFPTLFDLIDAAGDAELEGVDSADFTKVADGCTLCDMCFMTKCPYVPPHEFDLDFPHLMLRYRAVEHRGGKRGFRERQLTRTDRNIRLCRASSGRANWATRRGNRLTRPALEAVAGVHRDAALPAFAPRSLEQRAAAETPEVDRDAPAHGRKAAIYATCYGNGNNPEIGIALLKVLARNGVETEVVYPGCCGMPQIEQGDLKAVAAGAARTAAAFRPWIDRGYAIVATVSSCALMLKFEWPLMLPDNEDVRLLSENCFDAAQYVVDIAKTEGLAEGLEPLDGGVTLHVACHARAQNMGVKAAELLRLIPGTKPKILSRCSGHGGSWGVMKENFETGMKVGKPVMRDAAKAGNPYIASECPLAGAHILQGMERIDGAEVPDRAPHPIELFAKAYGY